MRIRFAGEGAGIGELSWGQLGIWRAVADSGNSLTLSGVAPLPAGTTVQQVADLVGWLVGRHPALRTTYEPRSTRPPLQRCAAAGELAIEVVETADPDTTAEEIRQRYQAEPFTLGEWPLRVALVTVGDEPVRQVAAYAHLALDAGGLDALLADLLARDPLTGDAPPPAGLPPLEQARWQASPAGRRQQVTALRYLEQILADAPTDPLGPVRPDGEDDHAELIYRTPALRPAAKAAAERIGVGSGAVVLAAYARAVAAATGRNPVLVSTVVGNRFRPGLAGSVSTVSQLTPLLVDADGDLPTVARRSAAALLVAAKHGYADPYAQDAVAPDRPRRCFLNDLRGPDDQDSYGEPELHWTDDPQRPLMGLYLHVTDVPGAVELRLSGDLRHFTRAQLADLARSIETNILSPTDR